jgi:hypothetical protein
LRKFLFLAVLNMVSPRGILRQTYQRYLQRGMLKMKAMVAMTRKLLRIIFALVRDHSEYVHGYAKTKNLLTEAA